MMPLAPRAAAIDHRDQLAVGIVGIGIDAGERAYAAARRPGARALAVRHGDALAAFDQRQHLATRQQYRLQRPDGAPSPHDPDRGRPSAPRRAGPDGRIDVLYGLTRSA